MYNIALVDNRRRRRESDAEILNFDDIVWLEAHIRKSSIVTAEEACTYLECSQSPLYSYYTMARFEKSLTRVVGLVTAEATRFGAGNRNFAVACCALISKKEHGEKGRSCIRKMSTSIEDPYLRHLFDADPTFNVYNKNVVNLSVGAPGPDLLQQCSSLLAKATKHRLEEEEKEGKFYLFQYGITAGLWECREELAKFLTRRYGDPVQRENLILTCGATHGLQLILTSVMAPNGVIFVDEVTYMIALDAFKQFPMKRVVSVPMKDDVVDLDAFEKIVKEEKRKSYTIGNDKIFWAMYYTVPTFHNPTGMSLSPEMSRRLVKMARENWFAVVCDDVYNLLHYKAEYPPHRLFNYDDPKDPDYYGGNVISNGSFSKILSPAIRVGWIECGPRVANILKDSGILKSGGAVNHYVSGLIASILQLKLEDEYLDNLIRTYRERMKALCNVLDNHLPSNCSYRHPEGGYFVWIKLPEDFDALPFMKWCQEVHKVMAIPGARFSNHGKSKNYIRVSISFHSAETIAEATKVLCNAITEYTRTKLLQIKIQTKL
ncbi:hypothetical protein TSAR_016883 [Trichomalopsis sarcophagae]|uniref:Aminotransferase class I/classII large domain-containing protein n=1 Tax=Trichomalopsis sarcophagae TaxID=543379 RepID=A0A232F3X2_9HYME|nr:hypothetical protein TSAR_016883 [Trichomalopsis sarcophagae]